MKKILYSAMILSLAFATSCSKDKSVAVTGVTLNHPTTTLNITETITLTATVLPEGATNKSVSWSSNDTDVATVNNGVVTALSAGAATITVTTQDGNKTATCAVTVNSLIIAVESVTLNHAAATLSMLDAQTLTPTVLPVGATNQSVSWSSNNTAVATVSNGTVTPVGYGNATITVTTIDGNKTATCAITVNFLGEVSFKSATIWTIEAANGAPKQEWSDVVMASGAKKNSFNGNVADARQNPGYGDLFSWYAVDTYKNQLCPAGWRVPIQQDFIDLDKALGGNGGSQTPQFVTDNYINRWGGTYGSYCNPGGVMLYQGSWAIYWSATEYDTTDAYSLGFDVNGYIYPQGSFIKDYGSMLRCVRN